MRRRSMLVQRARHRQHDAEAVAIRRMRPNFQTAFRAWRATDPDHNPNAPGGPQNMPEYKVPMAAKAKAETQG